jgi:hypothetical protein
MGTLVSALGCYLSVVLMFFLHLIVHHGRSARELETVSSSTRQA